MHNIAHSPKMLSVTPALPGRNIPAAVAFYRDRLGFEVRHVDGGLGIMGRDEIEIHLSEANNPHTPGAEPHLAGSASFRVQVNGVHGLYDEYRDQGVIHPNGALRVQPWDVEDFTILDLDGNAVAFFERIAPGSARSEKHRSQRVRPLSIPALPAANPSPQLGGGKQSAGIYWLIR